MINSNHIVDYASYCSSCKYYEEPETSEQCEYCLASPVAPDSRKPIGYRPSDDG